MKRKKNFFLGLWTLVLFGLSTFVLPVNASEGANNITGIEGVALFCNGRWAYTEPYEFHPDTLNYKASIPVQFEDDPSPVYLAINFKTGEGTAMPVTVRIGDVVQKALDGGSDSKEQSLPEGYKTGSYDSVYVVNLEPNVGDHLVGTLTFGSGNSSRTYTLTVTRVANLDIANLKTLFVDSGAGDSREKSESFNPEFDPKQLTGAYSDTLKAEIDTAQVGKKFNDLAGLPAVKAEFAEWGVSEVKWSVDESAGSLVAVTTTEGIDAADTVKLTAKIEALIKQAVGAASDSLIGTKNYKLNFELADPNASVKVTFKGDNVSESNDVDFGADKTSFSILPRYTYTITVTSQNQNSTGTFTFNAVSGVSFKEGQSFQPGLTIGSVEKEVEGVDDSKLGENPYGPRVDSIWLESLDGFNYSVSPGFHEDTLVYTAGISASSSYMLVFASSSGEPEVERKAFTLFDKEGNPYYELRVYFGKELKKTYTVRTYFLDSVTTLQSLVLSYDAEKKDVIDFEAPGFGADYSSFVSKAVMHDKDSIYLHIVPDSKLTKVSVSGDTEGKTIIRNDNDSLIIVRIATKTEGKEYHISVDLTAEDKSNRKYTVRIPKSFDLSLKSVRFGVSDSDEYPITLAFHSAWDSDSGVYRVTVPANVEFTNVRATPKLNNNANAVANSILEHHIDGTYDYTIRVAVAGFSGEKTYKFTFVHPSNNADLRFLGVVPGSLDRDFAPEDTFYTVTLSARENKIVIVAFPDDSLASVEGNREWIRSNTVDTFKVTVTAEDKLTTKVYLIEVRNPTGIAPVSSAAGIYVSNGVLYVDTPEAERITVYTTGGKLLSGVSKQAGKISFAGLRGLLIVRGSSGWVKKVLI